MQERAERTPPSSPRASPRELEEQRLRKETNGIFPPAKSGFFDEKRKELIERYVREGLEKFDAQQNQDEDELIFVMEL